MMVIVVHNCDYDDDRDYDDHCDPSDYDWNCDHDDHCDPSNYDISSTKDQDYQYDPDDLAKDHFNQCHRCNLPRMITMSLGHIILMIIVILMVQMYLGLLIIIIIVQTNLIITPFGEW